MVKDIIPASPASKNAQVRIGDIIIDVDGNDVSHLKVRVRVCKTLTHARARTHTHTHTHTHRLLRSRNSWKVNPTRQ